MNSRLAWVVMMTMVFGCDDGDPPPVDTGTSAAGTSTTQGPTSDATTGEDSGDEGDSTGTELPDIECETEVVSDLPGVSIEIESECAQSLTQAQTGLTTSYVIGIADALDGVDSGTSCYETPRGGIHVEWSVSGNGHNHCHCDVGLCPEYTPSPTTLVPGDTTGEFGWVAYDWNGPSDFDPPYGDPFVAGTYTIEVVATGFYDNGEDAMTPFTVQARRPIVLVE